MLRVHDGGVLRRETEKAGVEKVDVRQNRLRFDITRILDQFRRFGNPDDGAMDAAAGLQSQRIALSSPATDGADRRDCELRLKRCLPSSLLAAFLLWQAGALN